MRIIFAASAVALQTAPQLIHSSLTPTLKPGTRHSTRTQSLLELSMDGCGLTCYALNSTFPRIRSDDCSLSLSLYSKYVHAHVPKNCLKWRRVFAGLLVLRIRRS
ncbi:unnamed protein product [Coffea canephora]|uniref:Uncharacterized protein n=1 Tax=Coffea canephora TaxID=49390 RepID=A0A068V4E7_COFCA|nr:unnamed protein product [Coffea canephora]